MNELATSKDAHIASFAFLYTLIKERFKQKIAPITSVQTNKPLVALTFDDGPHPLYTPILLSTLSDHQAHATFFMVGQHALQHKHIVQIAASAGHEIGNHTMDHISMLSIPRQERWKQLQMCKTALFPYGNRYFRPPHGEQNGWTNLDAIMHGYESIGWNLDVEDWWNTKLSSMADELRQKITNGSIILFHDAIYDQGYPKHKTVGHAADVKRDVMLELVKLLLKEFSGRFRFVTISEMLKHGKAKRRPFV